METKSGIYCIENTVNGKKYIGSSIDMFKRKNRHFSELRNNKHKNSKLQNSFNKHGFEFFIFYVLEFINDKNELIVREQYHIDKDKPEYNINLIANSSLGVKRSEETKEKVRQANLGLKHPEWRNKIKSESQGGDNHWTKNKEFSDESKKKMSESQKKLYDNGYENKNKKIVYQLNLDGSFVKEWDSVTLIEKELGFSRKAISACLNNRNKTSNNYIWKFKEKEL
jgi:group I intron endonuclease